MNRSLFALPCAFALRHDPAMWNYGPISMADLGSDPDPDVSESPQYMEMPLDHFSDKGETWQYKYFVVDTYFQKGGALVLNMPGEGPTNGCRAATLVKSLGALAVCSEHRFFGTSVPQNSSTVKALRYHSVEQNLADQVALVKHIRSRYPSVTKVVSNGGSYPGSSSAWIRDQYPKVIDAAIAESPPLVAKQAFSEYDVSNLVALASPDARCANTMARVKEAIERQMETNRSSLFSLFKADDQITSDLGDSDFIYGVGDVTAYHVQYGTKAEVCNALKPLYNRDVSDVEYTEVFANFTLSSFGDEYFVDCAYNSTCIRDATHDFPASSMRSWFWLTCTQLGWFQIAPQTGLGTRPRPYDERKALEQCEYIYPGAKLISDASVKAFNEKYGGATMKSMSKIFELDFSDDPWSGITSVPQVQRRAWPMTLDQPFLYLTCDGCAHCGSGVPETKQKLILEQKIAFLRSWGIPVMGNQSAVVV